MTAITLAVSGTQTLVSNSVIALKNATLITYLNPWARVTFPTAAAKWVWIKDPVDGGLENITVKHDFAIQCPGQPLTFTTNVDNQFIFELNGVTGMGNEWPTTYSFTVPTTGITCGTNDNNRR